MPTRDQTLLHLNVEIEKLERRLKGFQVPLLPGQQRHEGAFERMIERKKVLEAERERLLGTSPANNARPVTQAPPPITPLRGSWIPPGPERTQTPSDLPPYYPNDLIPQTQVILTEAVREFSDQTRTLELCKHVISRLTPLFRKAVKSGTLQAKAALSNSGMEGLLHCLLVCNCDNENERSRLKQEARASDEWLKLTKQIAYAVAGTGPNIDRLRKECGWSFDQLAKETGIDKKLILSHVNKGTKPHPRIMKEYAQAFTKKLGRQITIAALEK